MTTLPSYTADAIQVPGVQILAEVGRGSQSIVYRASRGDRIFAVKIPKDIDLQKAKDTMRQFLREAAVLARVRHPGLAEIVDVGETQGHPYLVMEYVEGKTLASLLEDGPLQEEQTVNLIKILAGALAAVHSHGLVHRDVKPHNVLVTKAGAKLIDFGFAVEAREVADGKEVIGTFLYSAPEQTGILKRPVDGRSDLYSLGVVLFECLTGTTPFRSSDAGELIRQHAVMAPPEVRDINPSISPALGLIVGKLLSKDPDDRYQSAYGLIADLDRLAGFNSALKYGQEVSLGVNDDSLDTIYEIPLVGRDTELAILRNCWKNVTKGTGTVILVEGEPGSGKSRLFRELVAKAKTSNALVLKGKGFQTNPMPLGPLREAVEEYLRKISLLPQPQRQNEEDRVRRAAGELAPLLKRFTPALAALLQQTADVPELTEAQDLFYYAIADFLLLLAKAHPAMLIHLDDIQWLDEASRQVLTRLVSQIKDVPLMLACAARNDKESMPNLDRFINEMSGVLLTRLRLVPLLGNAIAKLVAAHLGGHEIDRAFIDQIATRSNGNPLAVGEYVRAMLDSGLLRPSWGTWLVDTQGLERLQLPTDVVQLVVKRIGELEPRTKSILQIAAVMGSRFRLDLLPLVCGTRPADVHAAFAEATLSRLVERGDGGEYSFVHDRVQEALLSGLPEEELRNLHQKVAEVLDASGGEGPEFSYALARHYSSGEVEKNPQKVFDTNFNAGLKALENYALEEAYNFLNQAYEFAISANLSPAVSIEETLGNACVQTGRLSEAIVHLERALGKATDGIQRALLRGRITRIHVANLRINEAKDELARAFGELGKKPPSLGFLPRAESRLSWMLYRVFDKLEIGYGKAAGKAREKTRVLAQLYEHASLVNYFEFNLELSIQSSIRSLRLVHSLGPSRELVLCHLSFGLSMALKGEKNIATEFMREARKLADQLGDPLLVGHAIAYDALRTYFVANDHNIEVLIRALEDYGRSLPIEDVVNLGGALIWNFLVRGYANETLKWANIAIKKLDSAGYNFGQTQNHFTAWINSFAIAASSLLGKRSESLEYIKIFEKLGSNIPYHLGIYHGNMVLFHIEQGELGPPLEQTIRAFKALGINPETAPIHLRHFYIFQAHARLAQCMNSDPQTRSQHFMAINAALDELRRVPSVGPIEAHILVMEGSLARLQGRNSDALSHLASAEQIARTIDCPIVSYEASRQRAHIFQDRGNQAVAIREARFALSLAVENGWSARARQIRTEFSVNEASRSVTKSHVSTRSSVKIGGASVGLQRHLDALLQLGLASATILDPDKKARVVLDQIVRLLGAERAFLFLCKEDTDELFMSAGRDADGNDLRELKGYSSTVVEQVRSNQKPLVVSGTEEGAILGSESAVAHDLRSIMAAPLLMGDRLAGVVYLDNRLAKGIFTEDDVKILLALANHIAISLETARAAQIEMERKALEKDLELAGAVQSLLLPKEDVFSADHLRMAAFYQPAAQSGGDWWWYDVRQDGSILVLLGDVTGHGAGSAMMTAAIASSYRTLQILHQSLQHDDDIPAIFEILNTNLLKVGGDMYSMTMSAVEIHPERGEMRFWSAGAPPMFVLNPDGKVDTLVERSTPLGTDRFQVGEKKRAIARGSRVFLFTDGAYEFSLVGGRQLGLRKLQNLFIESKMLKVDEARTQLVEQLKDLQSTSSLEDDMTFVLLDFV